MYGYYLMNRGPEIVAFAQGDVTGDRVEDDVYLTGVKTDGSPFLQTITLHIRDVWTGGSYTIPLQENAGYEPSLFLGDFTGNGIADILVSIVSGGSGGMMFHYIYSFVNNKPQLLFDYNVYNGQYSYSVQYRNNYKVEVKSSQNNETYIIDISLRDPSYLNEIYSPGGKLKQPIEGFVNPLSSLFPVDVNNDKVFELLAYQKIAGRYNADALGYIVNTLGWKDGRFVLQNQYAAISGN